MHKLSFIFLNLLFFTTVSFSQLITPTPLLYNGVPVATNISVGEPFASNPPYLNPGSWQDLNNNWLRRASLFIEYGDGYFTTLNNTNHSFNSNSSTALITARGKYDVGHPHARISYQNLNVAPTTNQNSQDILNTYSTVGQPKNIAILADVNDLIENDQIQVVITFKKTFTGPGKILFYYNSNMKAFDAINPSLSGGNLSFNVKDVNNNQIQSPFDRVRTYNNSIVLNNNIKSPLEIQNQYPPLFSLTNNAIKYINNNLTGPGSLNALVFNIDSITDNLEHNIFVTLTVPISSIYSAEKSYTDMYAYIMPDAFTLNPSGMLTIQQQIESKSSSLSFSAAPYDIATGLRAHDPNYICANKQCVDVCSQTAKAEDHKYKVHFQNDGSGSANFIEVTVLLDPKYEFTSKKPLQAVKGIVANREHTFYFKYKISKDGQWNKIVFTFNEKKITTGGVTDVKLHGTVGIPNPETNPLTMGDIFFTVKTKDNQQPTFYSIASIVFNNELPVKTKLYGITCCEGRKYTRPIPVSGPIKDIKKIK